MGRNCRNYAILAQITWLHGGNLRGLQRGEIPQLSSITRYGASPLRGYKLHARRSSDEATKVSAGQGRCCGKMYLPAGNPLFCRFLRGVKNHDC